MGAPAPSPAGTPTQSLLDMWSVWEIQAVVAASFGLQVILFFFAGVRRYSISSVLKVFLWLVYMLADAAAVYALGHMSALLSNTSSDKHQLVAFWAPFLLLHLGGQDTITAYALEDNELWVRHLLNMFVQVAGTGYVLHKYIIADRGTIVYAAVLISVAGFVKYGERIWALKCASKGSNWPYLTAQQFRDRGRNWTENLTLGNYEFIVRSAHSYHSTIFKPLIIDMSGASAKGSEDLILEVDTHVEGLLGQGNASAREKRCMKEMYRVIEMQLGLAYDMLYTKAQVIHTWYGYLIRVISFASCFGALVAFTKSKRDRYSTPDIVITFVLLGGACTLEVASAFKLIGSTWTYAMLRGRKWDWLARAVLFARYHLLLVKDGRWSNSIGQYDFISFCDSDRTKLMAVVSCCFHFLGFGDWWYKIKKSHHTKHIKLSPAVKDFVWGFLRGQKNHMVQIEDVVQIGDVNIRGGYWPRRLKGFPQSEELDWSLKLEFHNCVFIWHIATSTFLSDPAVKSELDRAVESREGGDGEGERGGREMSILWEKSPAWRWLVGRTRDSKPFFFTFATLCGVVPGVVGYGVMQLTSSRNDKLEAHLRSNARPETTMMGQVNRERLAEFLGEIQRKEDTNDRYVAALKGETLTRKPYQRIQPVQQQPAQENTKDQQATQGNGKAK